MAFDENTHWRDASRPARFFFMDAKAAFPLILFLLHISWLTFWIALVCTLFFASLEHFKISLPVLWRLSLSYLAGEARFSKPWWRQ